MNFETFNNLIKSLENIQIVNQKLYDLGFENSTYTNGYDTVITLLIKEIYGEKGYEWFSWFCYENNFGGGKLKAWDENLEICFDINSLWKYIEENHKIKPSSGYCANCQSSKENCTCKYLKLK